jgi:hypothetical protein
MKRLNEKKSTSCKDAHGCIGYFIASQYASGAEKVCFQVWSDIVRPCKAHFFNAKILSFQFCFCSWIAVYWTGSKRENDRQGAGLDTEGANACHFSLSWEIPEAGNPTFYIRGLLTNRENIRSAIIW